MPSNSRSTSGVLGRPNSRWTIDSKSMRSRRGRRRRGNTIGRVASDAKAGVEYMCTSCLRSRPVLGWRPPAIFFALNELFDVGRGTSPQFLGRR